MVALVFDATKNHNTLFTSDPHITTDLLVAQPPTQLIQPSTAPSTAPSTPPSITPVVIKPADIVQAIEDNSQFIQPLVVPQEYKSLVVKIREEYLDKINNIPEAVSDNSKLREVTDKIMEFAYREIAAAIMSVTEGSIEDFLIEIEDLPHEEVRSLYGQLCAQANIQWRQSNIIKKQLAEELNALSKSYNTIYQHIKNLPINKLSSVAASPKPGLKPGDPALAGTLLRGKGETPAKTAAREFPNPAVDDTLTTEAELALAREMGIL